jgi:hypothetical protein
MGLTGIASGRATSRMACAKLIEPRFRASL